jgi:hypothetical protein
MTNEKKIKYVDEKISIHNMVSAKKCLEYMKHSCPDKVEEAKLFLYSEMNVIPEPWIQQDVIDFTEDLYSEYKRFWWKEDHKAEVEQNHPHLIKRIAITSVISFLIMLIAFLDLHEQLSEQYEFIFVIAICLLGMLGVLCTMVWSVHDISSGAYEKEYQERKDRELEFEKIFEKSFKK